LIYITPAIPIWRMLLMHAVCLLRALALLNAGSNIAARMAMMAITTSNSIKVNPVCFLTFNRFIKLWLSIARRSESYI